MLVHVSHGSEVVRNMLIEENVGGILAEWNLAK